MKILDNHVHTHFSIDAKDTMEDVIKRAIDIGVDYLTFTDHLEYNTDHFSLDIPQYISKIAECKYRQISEPDSYTGKVSGVWLPEMYYENTQSDQEITWNQSADGYLSPEMSYPPYASAIIGWKAPESGRYSFNVSLFAGSTSADDSHDGVDISLYCGSRKVTGKSIKIPSNFIYGFEADLEKDEYMDLLRFEQMTKIYADAIYKLSSEEYNV